MLWSDLSGIVKRAVGGLQGAGNQLATAGTPAVNLLLPNQLVINLMTASDGIRSWGGKMQAS